jgi:hypothetical protein
MGFGIIGRQIHSATVLTILIPGRKKGQRLTKEVPEKTGSPKQGFNAKWVHPSRRIDQ